MKYVTNQDDGLNPEDFTGITNATLIRMMREDAKWYEVNTPLIRTATVLREAANRLEAALSSYIPN